MEPVDVTIHADRLDVPERLVVAPAGGVFRALPEATGRAGAAVRAGQPLGSIERLAGEVAVVSPHAGRLMGLLAVPGERVRDHQPVAWVRVAE